MKTLIPRYAVGLILFWLLIGCRQSSWPGRQTSSRDDVAAATRTSIPELHQLASVGAQRNARKKQAGEIRVLFIGNSHSTPIPRLLTDIFKRHRPQTKTLIRNAPFSGFLVDHSQTSSTLELIRAGQWDYVVLQAQKYSTTGKYTYPIDGAMQLAKVATDSGAKILMYPEWSRAGVPDEYRRIKLIHNSIAEKTGARVAPIGEAWAAASVTDKNQLYAADGNHASPAGSYLNACVFYAMITLESPVRTPGFESTSFPEHYQRLEKAAWSAFQAESD